MKVILYYGPDGNEHRLLDASSEKKRKDAMVYLFNYFRDEGCYDKLEDVDYMTKEIDGIISALRPIQQKFKDLGLDEYDTRLPIDALNLYRERCRVLSLVKDLYTKAVSGDEESIVKFFEERVQNNNEGYEDYFEIVEMDNPEELRKVLDAEKSPSKPKDNVIPLSTSPTIDDPEAPTIH